MANLFTDYECHGPADARAVRWAAVVDLGIGAFLAVLAWPFPVARIVLTDATGSVALGWAVHIALLLLCVCAMDLVYVVVARATLGRSVGMYFNDLGFDDGAARAAILGFAAGWVVAGIAGLVGATGPAGRTAATTLFATRRRS